jgi:hypothetical protein
MMSLSTLQRQSLNQRIEQLQRQILNQKMTQLQRQILNQKMTQLQRQILNQKMTQLQKTIQLQRTSQTQLEKTQRLTRPQKPEPFGFDFGFKFGEEKVKKGKPKEKDILDWGFIAEVRRKGKFKPVSKAVSKKEAFLIGEDIVKNTLGASFRVKKTAKKIKVKKKPSAELSWLGNSEFYKKQERGEDIFIQKKEKRLSTKGERKEIQKSKRAKQKSFF